jgi:hypothetical protein
MALRSVLDKLVDPEGLLKLVRYLYGHPTEVDRSEILLKDGRIFDRYSAPIIDATKKYYGRVWYFRDVSELKKSRQIRKE